MSFPLRFLCSLGIGNLLFIWSVDFNPKLTMSVRVLCIIQECHLTLISVICFGFCSVFDRLLVNWLQLLLM